MHTTEYSAKVPDEPNVLFKKGNVMVRIAQENQRAKVATDMAWPLMLLGKISDSNTQVMGARVRQYMLMAMTTQKSMKKPLI